MPRLPSEHHLGVIYACLAALVAAGCGSNPDGYKQLDAPEASAGGVHIVASSVTLAIDDFEGEYRLIGRIYTDFTVPIGSFQGQAWAETGYAQLQEVIQIQHLVLSPSGEVEIDTGLPVFDYAQLSRLESQSCYFDVWGQAVPYALAGQEDSPSYDFRGSVRTDCLGEELEMETGIFYDEPGVLVGDVVGGFGYVPTSDMTQAR